MNPTPPLPASAVTLLSTSDWQSCGPRCHRCRTRTVAKSTGNNGIFYVCPRGCPPRAIPRTGPSTPAGRNAPCPCGSGRKYKKCHGDPAARLAPVDTRVSPAAVADAASAAGEAGRAVDR